MLSQGIFYSSDFQLCSIILAFVTKENIKSRTKENQHIIDKCALIIF